MVRLKFCCLSLTNVPSDGWVAKLAPVIPKSASAPEGSEENALFFQWTPSGSLEITGKGAAKFAPGTAYYIDLEPIPDEQECKIEDRLDVWEVYSITLFEDATEPCLKLPWFNGAHGSLNMRINVHNASKPFLEAGPGSRWRVAFTQA